MNSHTCHFYSDALLEPLCHSLALFQGSLVSPKIQLSLALFQAQLLLELILNPIVVAITVSLFVNTFVIDI
jgi:hypothetical protein